MTSAGTWALFFVVSALAILLAKRLDDRERRREAGRQTKLDPRASSVR